MKTRIEYDRKSIDREIVSIAREISIARDPESNDIEYVRTAFRTIVRTFDRTTNEPNPTAIRAIEQTFDSITSPGYGIDIVARIVDDVYDFYVDGTTSTRNAFAREIRAYELV